MIEEPRPRETVMTDDADTVVIVGSTPMPQHPASSSSSAFGFGSNPPSAETQGSKAGHYPPATLAPHSPSTAMGPHGLASWPPVHASLGRAGDYEGHSSRIFTLKTATRALKRYWWQFLLVWMIGSASLMALAYAKIKPVYTTLAIVGVTPQNWGDRDNSDRDEEVFIESEAALVTNPDVLDLALVKKPQLKDLELLRSYPDVQGEIERLLKVSRRPNTNLIQIGMLSHRPDEAAEIINAIVIAFIDQHSVWTKRKSEQIIPDLETQIKGRQGILTNKQEEAKTMARALRDQNLPLDLDRPNQALAALDTVSPELFDWLKQELREAEIRVRETEARIQSMESRSVALKPNSDALREAENYIRSNPALLTDMENIEKLQRVLERSQSTARSGNDPILKNYQRTLRDLTKNYQRKADAIRNRYLHEKTQTTSEYWEDRLDLAKIELATWKVKIPILKEELKNAKLELPRSNHEGLLKLEFVKTEVRWAEQAVESLKQKLNEIKNEAESPPPIDVRSLARPTGNKPTDQRMKIMAAIPLGWGFASFFLFLLLEARAGRVTDPEDIPDRLRLPVIGVVPPIPDLREAQRRSLKRRIRSQREIDLFVQCLDHLRVVLCSPGATSSWRQSESHKRCVLIASAVGGEGKTTLAAQLAGRCANAGLSTLLIDADMRNPSLSWRLDASERPGLADVLMGQIDAESALRLIEDGGGFHLMPAGAPQTDPSRLLQSDRLGTLIARLRASFDVVIIDAPPILPVPDALLIGRWTEGAIMTVRREASRFPLVLNAKQRLHAVGLPVLGVVVNGVKPFSSGYDSHYGYPSTVIVS